MESSREDQTTSDSLASLLSGSKTRWTKITPRGRGGGSTCVCANSSFRKLESNLAKRASQPLVRVCKLRSDGRHDDSLVFVFHSDLETSRKMKVNVTKRGRRERKTCSPAAIMIFYAGDEKRILRCVMDATEKRVCETFPGCWGHRYLSDLVGIAMQGFMGIAKI